MYNNQRISKKKTHVKKRTLNPVFNESFVFDLPRNESGLGKVKIILKSFFEVVTKIVFKWEAKLRDFDQLKLDCYSSLLNFLLINSQK